MQINSIQYIIEFWYKFNCTLTCILHNCMVRCAQNTSQNSTVSVYTSTDNQPEPEHGARCPFDCKAITAQSNSDFSLTTQPSTMLCLRSEDAFVITCVANLMEVKVLCVQQVLRYEIYSYWRFNV
jgi:hypothetical protein